MGKIREGEDRLCPGCSKPVVPPLVLKALRERSVEGTEEEEPDQNYVLSRKSLALVSLIMCVLVAFIISIIVSFN
jgi:hypothetical protein